MNIYVENTQNKIYNIPRRTYIDKTDCKEGEQICRKCEGVGQVTPPGGPLMTCSQCFGKGIVDWVTQAVKRPPMSDSSSSGSSTSVSASYTGNGKTYGPHIPLNIPIQNRMIQIKKVTNYKRRKGV